VDARDPALSVVIPVLDEAESVVDLLGEVAAALGPTLRYEVVVVDDGSRDATPVRLRELLGAGGLPLRVLRHRTRLGQSAALRSGIAAARADWVATLDGDGQNDPGDIPRLLEAREREGQGELRLLCGWRRRREDGWRRRVASRVANAVRRRALGDGTPDTGCGLRLVHRATYLDLPFFDHQHRFLPALVTAAGGRVVSVEVGHRPRTRGRSKYALGRRLSAGIVDLLGVLWLRRRSRRFDVEEIDAPEHPRSGAMAAPDRAAEAAQSVRRWTGERP
jgi:dolichol-phosphate mannosyltransferase